MESIDRELFTKRDYLIKEGYFTEKHDMGGEGAFESIGKYPDLICDPVFAARLIAAEDAKDVEFFVKLADSFFRASKRIKDEN